MKEIRLRRLRNQVEVQKGFKHVNGILAHWKAFE